MKIIITDCDHKDINIETKVLNDAGLNFELKQCHSEEDVILQCQDADALIVQYAKITKKVMDSLPNLKMIVRYGVGVDTIDIEEATKHNIQVCNVPDYGMNEVADHAIALMMAMTRKIVLMNMERFIGSVEMSLSFTCAKQNGRDGYFLFQKQDSII